MNAMSANTRLILKLSALGFACSVGLAFTLRSLQVPDPAPQRAERIHNVYVRNAMNVGQGASGSAVPLSPSATYRINVQFPVDALAGMRGNRRWVIFYQWVGSADSDCERTLCWNRWQMVSSRDSGTALTRRFTAGLQGDRLLVTAWSPLPGDHRTVTDVDRTASLYQERQTKRRGTLMGFVAPDTALIPKARMRVTIVRQ